MKICYLSVWPGYGGAEKYSLYLAEMAEKEQNEVSFMIGEKGPLSDRLKKLKIDFHIIPMKTSFNPILVLQAILRLKRYFKEKKITLVHTQMLREHSFAIGAKFLGAKIKVVRTFHRLDQFNWKMKPLLSFYNWQTNVFIAVSPEMKNNMIQNGIKAEKIVQINNGVPEVKTDKHEGAIGFLGRLSSEKGILDFVLNNKNILKQTKLIIAGDGPELDIIVSATKNLRTELIGPINNLASFFSKISILIVPSKTESTLPLSAIEALSCGVPVITFDIPAIESVPLNDSVIFIERDNYEKMGKNVIDLLENKQKLEELSKKAVNLYRNNYTVEKMWKETKNLYQKILS